MIPRLVVATKNRDKVTEMEALILEAGIAGDIARDLDWEDVEETGATLEENALLKARAVVRATGLPALADDTGLEVAALGGAPGVHTGRYAGPDATYAENVRRLLEEMESVADRSATFRTVMVLAFPDGSEVVAEGSVEGTITRERRGSTGFGYDPVFEVDGRTLAEMSDAEKNEMSHRGNALRALAAALGSG